MSELLGIFILVLKFYCKKKTKLNCINATLQVGRYFNLQVTSKTYISDVKKIKRQGRYIIKNTSLSLSENVLKKQ